LKWYIRYENNNRGRNKADSLYH